MNRLSEITKTGKVLDIRTNEVYRVSTTNDEIKIRNVDDGKEESKFIWHIIRPCELMRYYEVYGESETITIESAKLMSISELSQLEELLEKFSNDPAAQKDYWFRNCTGKRTAAIASELRQRVFKVLQQQESNIVVKEDDDPFENK